MKLLKWKIKYLIISGLAVNPALTAVEDKITDISSLVKTTTDYNIKITETENKLTDHDHDKYITTPEFNKVTAENFAARLKQANLVAKAYFDDKLKSINRKTSSNKKKHLVVKNKLKKLKRFDLIYFRGKSRFEEDGTQNYLVFQPMYRYNYNVILMIMLVIIIFIFGNLKNCLMKILQLLIQLILNSIQNSVILVLKQE